MITKILIAHLSVIFFFGFAEVYLRYVVFSASHFVHIPGVVEFDRSNWDIGLKGKAHLAINKLGLRGEELSSQSDHNTIVLGSSGAMGWLLDNSETWPEVWFQGLRSEFPNKRLWVANGAKPGNRIVESYTQLKSLLSGGLKVDTVVIVAGLSEMVASLFQGQAFENDGKASAQIRDRAFTLTNGPFHLGYPALWHMIRIQKNHMREQTLPPRDFFKLARKKRGKSVKIEELPSLKGMGEEVQRSVSMIDELRKKYGFRLIFLTRPTLWSSHSVAQVQQKLWFGQFGNGSEERFPDFDETYESYYSEEALMRAAQQYNSYLMEACESQGLECYDVSKHLEKNLENFYDDAHLTPLGSQRLAKIVEDRVRLSEVLK